jgi:hypothetical protein
MGHQTTFICDLSIAMLNKQRAVPVTIINSYSPELKLRPQVDEQKP